ncbi:MULTISPECIES: hypothetical protein [unclassified Synechococcus]|uniref:hypothetical protein n=1 Tax=unclassified Synechococcus TaxID=2626047 RepID=UPI0006527069|nr:hypothetical protein [Synechococcus sp. WH 8020]AKN62264.1 hypothetical protein WB44_07185 [Synechococcus sp. WH 8020]
MPSLTALRPHLLGIISVLALVASAEVLAQESPMGSGYQSPQQRDVFQTVPGQNDQESVLDATNPMDLMNRLRRANAMNDATPPSDAIDAALKALESSQPAP